MKRLFIILTLAGSSFFTTSYAATDKGSPAEVTEAFQSSFTNAKDISWEQVGVLYKATFELKGQYRAAFYNADGELIALTKNLSSAQLPQALKTALKKEMPGYWITELFVVTIQGDDTYYVKLENAKSSIMLKSAGAKKWAVYQKNEK